MADTTVFALQPEDAAIVWMASDRKYKLHLPEKHDEEGLEDAEPEVLFLAAVMIAAKTDPALLGEFIEEVFGVEDEEEIDDEGEEE